MKVENQIARLEIMKMSYLCGKFNKFISNSAKLLDNSLETGKLSKMIYREIFHKYININDMNAEIGSLLDELIMEDSYDNLEIILAQFSGFKNDIKSILSKLHSIYVEEDFAYNLPELRDEYNILIKEINRVSYEIDLIKARVYSRKEENNTIKPTM